MSKTAKCLSLDPVREETISKKFTMIRGAESSGENCNTRGDEEFRRGW